MKKTTKVKTRKQPAIIKTDLEVICLVDGWLEGTAKKEDLLCKDDRGTFFLATANPEMHWLNDPINLPKKAFRKIGFLEALEWGSYVERFGDGQNGSFEDLIDEALRRLKSQHKEAVTKTGSAKHEPTYDIERETNGSIFTCQDGLDEPKGIAYLDNELCLWRNKKGVGVKIKRIPLFESLRWLEKIKSRMAHDKNKKIRAHWGSPEGQLRWIRELAATSIIIEQGLEFLERVDRLKTT